MVEDTDGLTLRDGLGKEHGRHIGTAPWTIDGEVAEAGGGYAIEFAVTVRHQFVRLLTGRIKTHGTVHLVVLGERGLGIESVYRTRRGEEQVLYGVITAALEDVKESHQVAREIGIGIGDGIAHASLGCQVHHPVETLGFEECIEFFLLLYTEADKTQVAEFLAWQHRIPWQVAQGVGVDAQLLQTPGLEPHIVIIVDIVESNHLITSACKHE